jgi:ABC-type transport system involved in cytochrome c biogenesis ATPase subunit
MNYQPVATAECAPNMFQLLSNHKIQTELTQQCLENQRSIRHLENYIHQLEDLLKNNQIEVPPLQPLPKAKGFDNSSSTMHLFKDGSFEEIEKLVNETKDLIRKTDVSIEFHELTLSSTVPKQQYGIFSIYSIFSSIFCFWNSFLHGNSVKKIQILSQLTGRISPRTMTLLIGPPGSGKSAFLKVLAGRLHPKSAQTLSGEVYYQGDNIRSEKFIVNKVADYIEQGDTHDPTLTVEETLDFAWHCTTGGLLSYGRAKDFLSAVELDQRPPSFFVHNMLAVLGLKGCKDTYVGNNMIRGVSGGQKRRVTIGEMMANPRPVSSLSLSLSLSLKIS